MTSPSPLLPWAEDVPLADGGRQPGGVSTTTLIEASAGTGKTYSITGLYVRLLLEAQVRVGQILVVTFTEAATAELRDRIRRRVRAHLTSLEAAAQQSGASETEGVLFLREALRTFDEATIYTIHGFCQRVLQQFAFESGAPPELEIMKDEGPLRAQVAQDFCTRTVHAVPLCVHAALEQSGFTPSTVMSLARKLGEGALLPTPEPPSEELSQTLQARFVAAHAAAAAAWRTGGAAARAALQASLDAGGLSGTKYKPARVEKLLGALARHLETGTAQKDLDTALELLSTEGFQRNGIKLTGFAPPVHPFFDTVEPLQTARDGMAKVACRRLADALVWMPAEMARRKAEQDAVSFGDLLSRVRDAVADPVRGPTLRGLLQTRHPWALIDEFQDTDPVQWEIFHRVFSRLFLIGDPKQAIYGFRGADLPTYLSAAEAAGRRFELRTNYRSDKALVDAVNGLFGQVALERPFHDPRIGFTRVGAKYEAPRLRGADGAGPPLIFRFIPRDDLPLERVRGPLVTAGTANRGLPRRVAADIAELLGRGEEILEPAAEGRPEHWRPVAPRDVAVLVRTNLQAKAIRDALADVGVPAVLHGDGSVFDSDEATDLAVVLEALLDPGRVGRVRGALSTRLFGLSAEIVSGDPQDLADSPISHFMETFRRLGDLWQTHGFLAAFRRLSSEQAFLPRWLGEDDGERKVTNLLHLTELLHGAERGQGLRPHALLAWYRRQLADGGSASADDAQLRLESDADALQIVTMHRSKGLEYGIVYLPYLWAGSPVHKSELAHPRYPLAEPGPAGERAGIYLTGDPPARDRAVERAAEAAQAENLRLLYVALTRAKHRCLIYWGGIRTSETSALAYVLHPAPGAGFAGVAKRFETLTDQQLQAELAALGAVERCPLRVERAPVYSAETTGEASLALATLDESRTRQDDFRRASYSALARGRHGTALPLHVSGEDELFGAPDAAVAVGATERVEDPTSPLGWTTLSAVPGGLGVGLALHSALERVAFDADEAKRAEGVERAMTEQGLPFGRDGGVVCRALAEILSTPFLEGVALCDLPASRRVPEMRFELALAEPGAAPVNAARIADAIALRPKLAAYAETVRRLDFMPFTGFLNGAIDLVFEHAGRYYLVDYKSSHLGPTWGDYTPDKLAKGMAKSHYHLQSHLYAVALEAFLERRLGTAYDADRHFGGAIYLFLRGMHPQRGAQSGVFHDPVPTDVRRALARALGMP